jgi:flagellar hook-associated protein 1 FlgK
MSDLFQGLEFGRLSLPTQQLSTFTTRHKVADSEAPGLTEPPMISDSTRSLNMTDGRAETVLQTLSVNQFRNTILASQYRRELNSLGSWTTMRSVLGHMEQIFSGSQGPTPGELLTRFHGSWHQLANEPTSASRQSVLEQAQALAQAFHDTDSHLAALEKGLNSELQNQAATLSGIGAQLAELNTQIASSELNGKIADDWRDKRNVLLDDLSRRVNISVEETDTGKANVNIGRAEFVVGTDVHEIRAELSTRSGEPRSELVWEYSGQQVALSGGELGALVQTRDIWIPESREALNRLAESLATQVNSLHRQGATSDGRTGISLFDPAYVTADRIQVSAQVADNPQQSIVTGRSSAQSDVDIAQALAGLTHRPAMPDGRTTLNGYYDSFVATIEMRSMEATDLMETQTLLVEQLESHRQSVMGASLDEELTQMIRFQHAHEAAARVTANMNEAVNTVINGMGIAGR